MEGVNLSADLVGRVIDGRYPLLRWLGGSDGSGVFLTELDGPGSQRVAIKIVAASYASAQAQLARWAEAEELSHPHLMKLLRTGRDQIDTMGIVYSVTEYADEVLADILKERALKPDEVKQLLVPVLDVLFYLHGRGHVHGHLKPSNVLVVRNHLLLSGDGLQVAGEPGKWFRGLTVYDAPESGEAMMAPPADVWSLGMLLAAALGHEPWEWDRESNKEPVISEDIPQPFARIALECLRLDPKSRCTLADVNKWRYEQVQADGHAAEKGRIFIEHRQDKETTRRGRLVILAGAAIAVALAVFGMMNFGGHPERGAAQKPVGTVHGEAAQPAEGRKPSVKGPAVARPEMQRSSAGASSRESSANAAKESAQAMPSAGGKGNGTVIQRVMPQAPQSALATIHGTVRVRVKLAVDASGNVTDASFADAGPSKYFARLAIAAAQKWRFPPGAAGGRTVEFDFRQTGVDAAMQ